MKKNQKYLLLGLLGLVLFYFFIYKPQEDVVLPDDLSETVDKPVEEDLPLDDKVAKKLSKIPINGG